MKNIAIMVVIAVVANLFLAPFLVSVAQETAEIVEDVDFNGIDHPKYPSEPVEKIYIEIQDDSPQPMPLVPQPITEGNEYPSYGMR